MLKNYITGPDTMSVVDFFPPVDSLQTFHKFPLLFFYGEYADRAMDEQGSKS